VQAARGAGPEQVAADVGVTEASPLQRIVAGPAATAARRSLRLDLAGPEHNFAGGRAMAMMHRLPDIRRSSGRGWLLRLFLLALLGAAAAAVPETAAQQAQRRAMVADIRRQADSDVAISARVLAAMTTVPRHRFVPADQVSHAYEDRPLAIGYGQTISQPYIVALMTTLARPGREQRVLEIGTGSGYQAAVLAELVGQVYTIEIVEPLAARAQTRLREQGYDNVHTRVGDGYYGWPEAAPFDAIVVTAAAASVPPPLIRQLKPGGVMVIPVGGSFYTQTLMLVEKQRDGRIRSRQIEPVSFVPLTGEH
jgi:protein-L-isoaspartate(D-aspartate) O-methyltransferase